MVRKSLFVFLFLLPFAKLCTANACDTLFTARKADVIFSTNLDTLGFDSTNVLARFHQPEGYLFQSTLANEYGYRLVFREGRRWKSWDAQLDDLEFGSFYTRRKQVDGCGRSELLIFWCTDFGHHSATHGEERSSYSLDVWSIDSAKLVLSLTYRTFHWWASMDFGGATDSLGNPWPPEADEEFDVAIGSRYVRIVDHSRVKTPHFADQAAFDSLKIKPEIYQLGGCALQEGAYEWNGGSWVKTGHVPHIHTPLLHPPEHHPYWEWILPGE
jgi:hypothetical protein